MPYENLIENLSAQGRAFDTVNDIPSEKIKISSELEKLLKHFKGSIVFGRGAKFKTDREIPTQDSSGYIDIDIIYGLEPDRNNIYVKNQIYKKQISDNLYVFGESGNGDQYCLDKNTAQVYYWYHEASKESDTTFLLSENLNDFLDALQSDEERTQKTKKIVSAKFDF